MVQTIERQDIWGNIGRNFGQGAGEGLVKEAERGRLSRGLEQFSKEAQGLTPLEQYAKIAAIPGITPQMIQALPEVLKQQARRSAFTGHGLSQNIPGSSQQEQTGFGSKLPVEFGSNRARYQPTQVEANINLPENLSQTSSENKGYNESNPLSAVPITRWTPERYKAEVAKIINQNPGITPEDAEKLALNIEERELAQAEGEQRKQNYLSDQQAKADQAYETISARKGVKAGDLDGETDQRLRNAMYDDIKAHPNMSEHQAAEKWSGRALNLAKAQTQFDKLASEGLFEEPAERKLNKLKNLQKIYNEAGNSEGFYNRLISDFNLTPQYAALVAYPRSNEVKKYINELPQVKRPTAKDSVAIAANIKSKIGDNDSLLAIARELKDKIRSFDETAFFNEIRDNQDQYRLNERQRRELSEAEASLVPSWGDIWLFPLLGSSKAHD